MRWTITEKTKPEVGERRWRRRFLFWPKRIGREWRWLEVAQYLQVFAWSPTPLGALTYGNYYTWNDEAWV